MAGTEVGSLYYDLGVDDKNLKAGLDNADKSVQGFGGSLSKFGSTVQAGFREVGKVLAVAGVGLTAYAKSATDFTENLVKSSKSLGREIGVTTSEASRLVAAFGRMGIEADSAAQMFGIFSKQIVASTTANKDNQLAMQKLQVDIEKTKNDIKATSDEITKSGDKTGDLTIKLKGLQVQLQQQQNDLTKNADSFQKLGISTVDASGKQKDFNSILFEVADKFKAMPDGVDKTTIALDLFGRSGKDMIKVLDLGAGGIQDLEKQADKLGLTLNAKTIGAVNGLIQSQKDLKEQTDAMKISVGTATAPVLTKFNEKLVETTQSLINAREPFHSLTVNTLAFGGPIAGATSSVAAFLGNLSSIGPKIGQLALKLGAVGLVVAVVAGGIYELQIHFHILNGIFSDTVSFLNQVKTSFDWMTSGANAATQPIGWLGNTFSALNTTIVILTQYWQQVLWPAIQAVGAAIWQNLAPAMMQLWDAVTRLWNALNPALIDALKILAVILAAALFAAIWLVVSALNVIIQVFAMVVSAVSNVINWISNLIGWFGNLVGVVWNTISTIGSILWNLPNAFRDVVGVLGSIAGGIGSSILRSVGNLGSLLYNAGKDLIQGMINGITDKFKELAGAVKNAVGSAVSAVKGFLGIHSPSTVFHEIGQNVTAGFVNGIQSSAHLAANAMSGFTDAIISPTVNLNPVGAAAAAAGNTTNLGNTIISIGTVNDKSDADYILNRADRNSQLTSMGIGPVYQQG